MSRSGGGSSVWRRKTTTTTALLVAAVVAAAAMVTCVTCNRSPVRHTVGGKRELWKPNYNYTDWSLQQTFYTGDWLYFVYNRYMFNVLEVNETSYNNCNDQGFIFNISRGAGRDVFELREPKRYYFLSSGGYCYGGMKLTVNVVDFIPAPQPSPPPTKSGSNNNMITSINPLISSSIMIMVAWIIFIKNQ